MVELSKNSISTGRPPMDTGWEVSDSRGRGAPTTTSVRSVREARGDQRSRRHKKPPRKPQAVYLPIAQRDESFEKCKELILSKATTSQQSSDEQVEYLKSQVNYERRVELVAPTETRDVQSKLNPFEVVEERDAETIKSNSWQKLEYRQQAIVFRPTKVSVNDFVDAIYDKNVADLVRMLTVRDFISLSPRTKLAIYSDLKAKRDKALFRSNPSLKAFVDIWYSSYKFDSMRMLKVFLPDKYMYTKEKEALNVALDCMYSEASRSCNEESELTLPEANFTVCFGSGGPIGVSFAASYNRMLASDETLLDVEHCVKTLGAKPATVRSLTAFERTRLAKEYPDQQTECPFTTILAFTTGTDCQTALEMAAGKNSTAIRAPSWLAHGGSAHNDYREEMQIDLAWPNYLPTGEVLLVLKDSREMEHCCRLLRSLGMTTTFEDGKLYDPTNCRTSVRNISDEVLKLSSVEAYFRNLMTTNGIELEQVDVIREQRAFVPKRKHYHSETFELDCRLMRACAMANLVNGPLLMSDDDYAKSLIGKPWTTTLHEAPDGQDAMAKATISFESVQTGIAVAQELLTSTEDVFRSRYAHRFPIQIKPRLLIRLRIQRSIRVACDETIRSIDASERDDTSDGGWTRIVDEAADEQWCELRLEGWPAARVRALFDRLDTLFVGEYIDCSGECYPLLYGLGSEWREQVRKEFGRRLVLDVNRLHMRLTLVGNETTIREARKRLRLFVEERHRIIVRTNIRLCEPRYMPNLYKLVKTYVKERKLIQIAGGANLRFLPNHSIIEFDGSLEQYQALMRFIDDFDDMVITSGGTYLRSSRPSCPICREFVDDSFYCLDACGHYYCLRCIILQVQASIQTRDFPMRCHFPKCEKRLTVTDIKTLVLGTDAPDRVRTLDWLKLKELTRSFLDHLLAVDARIMPCRTADCYGVFVVDEAASTVRCSLCDRDSCAGCGLEPHETMDCAAYKETRENAETSLSAYSRRLGGGRLKECPNDKCRAVIEKASGCNHMYCAMCKSHFCWICDHFLCDTHTTVYEHLMQEHDGLGANYRIENGQLIRGNDDGDEDELSRNGLPEWIV